MKDLSEDICWVYILEGVNFPHKRRILFCGDDNFELSVANQLGKWERLVYCRKFSDVFDALAHKQMLEGLSKKTVTYIIKQQSLVK